MTSLDGRPDMSNRARKPLLWPLAASAVAVLGSVSPAAPETREQLEVKGRVIYLITHLYLAGDVARDAEDQLERLGPHAIPHLVVALRATADPVAERCYRLLFRIARNRVPFTRQEYFRNDVTRRDPVAEWERWWRRKRDRWVPNTLPRLTPIGFERDRLITSWSCTSRSPIGGEPPTRPGRSCATTGTS
jgi:hypothetical protein